MNEPSHSDEELLALLQPVSMPEVFDFESNLSMKDASDHGGGDQPLRGPAPPAPIAPMTLGLAAPAPMEDKADSTSQTPSNMISCELVNGATNGFGSSQPTNEQQVEDEDEIAYEPIKTPSRTPRSAKSRTNATRPISRRKLASSKPSSKRREKAKLDREDREVTADLKPKTKQEPQPVPEPELETNTIRPPSLDFEIVINSISPLARQEYKTIPPGDEIYRVLERIPTGVPGETWLSVEFEDGRIDQVRTCLWVSFCGRLFASQVFVAICWCWSHFPRQKHHQHNTTGIVERLLSVRGKSSRTFPIEKTLASQTSAS